MSRKVWDKDDGLQTYLDSISRYPLLDRETEQKLARRYRRKKDQAAADRLVQSHLRFVVKLALGYKGYGLRLADLIEEGNLGLLEAVRRFDPERNLRFMTYAAYWIRAYMLAFVLKHWSIVGVGTGPLQSKMFFRLAQARAEMTKELGDDNGAVEENLATRFGTTVERIRAMTGRLAGRDTSLDGTAYDDSTTTLLDLLPDDGPSQEALTAVAERDAKVREILAEAWPHMDARERTIVEERLLEGDEGATLAELGTRLGLSRERVRQLEERLKTKLRRVLEPMAA